MKKIYKNIELEVLFFSEEDVIRTSQSDNIENMPDFPENFG